MQKFNNQLDYINSFQSPIKEYLELLQKIILDSIPNADYPIYYDCPAFFKEGNWIISFSATKKFVTIGFTSTETIIAFKDELKGYKVGKYTFQLNYDQKLPTKLITKLLKYRVKLFKGKIPTKKYNYYFNKV
jgi:uncharacterized protein YdhG (YjbR/CyaY superfamily)